MFYLFAFFKPLKYLSGNFEILFVIFDVKSLVDIDVFPINLDKKSGIKII